MCKDKKDNKDAWLESTCTGYAARFGPAFSGIGASHMFEVLSWLDVHREDGYATLKSSMIATSPHAEAAVEHALKELRAYAAAAECRPQYSSSTSGL